MTYGELRKLLLEEYEDLTNRVLIESPFVETSRNGRRMCSVQLALTPDKFIIASKTSRRCLSNSKLSVDEIIEDCKLQLRDVYPIRSVELSVFKQRIRQALKVYINNDLIRYFELGPMKKRKIFWKLWCTHAAELKNNLQTWPYTEASTEMDFEYLVNKAILRKSLQWTDKYLYLGSKREIEDNDRPIPVPGLGPTENLKLYYLKQRYFGCWDQSEHWVQCGNSSSIMFN